MNTKDVTKNPGFKHLRKLMDDPRYWRDQAPAYVEMIRQGFRDLYDSPAEAGEAANEAGVNGPVHAQDSEIGHLTAGEVVIPLSAQTPEIMQVLHDVLGEDLLKYSVGSGHEQINPTSGLPAFADGMSWHFEDRDAKNVYLPENVNDARQRGSKFEEYPADQNIAHDDGQGAPERKFGHPDGREAIYDGDTGELVTDEKRKGTYNYVNPRNNNKPKKTIADKINKTARLVGHGALDFLPWAIAGNKRGKRDDPNLIKLYEKWKRNR